MTTIAQERGGHRRVGYDDLIFREQWGARFDDYDEPRSVDEPADTQHVHITITNPGNYSSDAAHARGVEAIGIARFPNTGVSYNRLVMQSGRVYEGQPIGRRGAHTVNDFKRPTCTTSGCPGRGGSLRAPSWNNNITGRAYVICQNVDDEVTDAQLDALARVMAADRLAGFVRMDARIHGHRCCSSKSCPGNRMWARMGELKKLVDHYVRVGFGAGTPGGDDSMSAQEVAELKAWMVENVGRLVMGYSNPSFGQQDVFSRIRDAADFDDAELEQIAVRVWTQPVRRSVNGEVEQVPAIQELADAKTGWLHAQVELQVLRELVAKGGGVSVEDITAAVNAAFDEKVQDARVELVVASGAAES